MKRTHWLALQGLLFGLTLDIMVEDHMFTAPYVLPILCAALFYSGAASILTIPGFEPWVYARLAALRGHPKAVAFGLVGTLGLIAGATRVSSPIDRLPVTTAPTAQPLARYAVYVRTETTPMIVRCDGRFVSRLEPDTPFITIDVGHGDHVVSAEDPHSAFRYESPVRVAGDAPTAMVMIPGVPAPYSAGTRAAIPQSVDHQSPTISRRGAPPGIDVRHAMRADQAGDEGHGD
jgi:hypothetical protein